MGENLNIHAAMGTGRFRKPWAIREWLNSEGLKMSDIARGLNVSHALVSQAVRGGNNNRKVLDYLAALGCPKEYLGE